MKFDGKYISLLGCFLRYNGANLILLLIVKDYIIMKLSNREIEILSCLPYGLTDKEIASKLGISKRTVQTHVNRIFIKLGVRNRVSAACFFIRNFQDKNVI